MSQLLLKENLYIATHEFNHLIESLDTNGWRKLLKQNLKRGGLFFDPSGENGKIKRIGNQAIFIEKVEGLGISGEYFSLRDNFEMPVPQTPGQYHWIFAQGNKSELEEGLVSISEDGTLTGNEETKFLSKLRGGADLPTRIMFPDSQQNPGQFDVLSVTSDSLAYLNVVGMVPESNLHYKVIGTYDPIINTTDFSSCYRYDNCDIIVISNNNNFPPIITQNDRYLLGVAYYELGDIVIKDYRNSWVEITTGFKNKVFGEAATLGVERVQWDTRFSTRTENFARTSWCLRSSNWSIDYTDNSITLLSAQGGAAVNENFYSFGQSLLGYRVYSQNGNYVKISSVTPIQSNGTVRIQLSSLPVVDFQLNSEILICPDFDEIEIVFYDENQEDISQIFPINKSFIDFRLPTKEQETDYFAKYRLISNGISTAFRPFPASEVGYINEQSFNDDYTVNSSTIVRVPYAVGGPIKIISGPSSYRETIDNLVTGEKFGADYFNLNLSSNVYDFFVGTNSKEIIVYTQNPANFSSNIFINLKRTKFDQTSIRPGCEFVFNFKDANLILNGFNLIFTDNYIDGSNTGQELFRIDSYYVEQVSLNNFSIRFVFDGNSWTRQLNVSYTRQDHEKNTQRQYPRNYGFGGWIDFPSGIIDDCNNGRITGTFSAWGGLTLNTPLNLGTFVVSSNFGKLGHGNQKAVRVDNFTVFERSYNVTGSGGSWSEWLQVYGQDEPWRIASDAGITMLNGAGIASSDYPGWQGPDQLRVKRKIDNTVVFHGGVWVKPTNTQFNLPTNVREFNALLDFSQAPRYRPVFFGNGGSMYTFPVGFAHIKDPGDNNYFYNGYAENPQPSDTNLATIAAKGVCFYNAFEAKMYFATRIKSGISDQDFYYFDLTGLTYQAQ